MLGLGIGTFIFGFIVIVGFAVKKPNDTEIEIIKNPFYKYFFKGIKFIQGKLKWIIGVGIIMIAAYIIYDTVTERSARIQAERQAIEEANGLNQERLERLFHFSELERLVETPLEEREFLILERGFEQRESEYEYTEYIREPEGSVIKVFKNGVTNYYTPDAKNYSRLFQECKSKDFKYEDKIENNTGQTFRVWRKDKVKSTFGFMSDLEGHLISIANDRLKYDIEEFITQSFLLGKWGRSSMLHSGVYNFSDEGTFIYDDSRNGSISGSWSIQDKDIILRYNKKYGKYGLPHNMSLKTENITVKSKKQNILSGYADGNPYSEVSFNRR